MDTTNQKQLHKVEDICLRDAPPPCSHNCPAGVDARAMVAAIQKNDFSAAYKLFSSSVPFTRIISAVCGAPCESACVLGDVAGAIKINSLEKACVNYGYKKNVLNKAFLPKKNETVAVVGAGLGGFTAAYYLRRKGFLVDLYEKTDSIGGKLKDMLPENTIKDDFKIVTELGANIKFNNEINDFSRLCGQYNAVYVSTGGKYEFNIDEKTLYVKDNLFAGGSGRMADYSAIQSLSDAKCAVTSIERYLQNVSLTAERFKEEVAAKINTAHISADLPVFCSDGMYSKEQAVTESVRCINCRCDECVKGCAYLRHYNTDPKTFIREVRNCLAISVGNRYANEAVNSCSECGFCKSVCPVGLDTGAVCADAKKKMVQTNKMPPSAHDFALKDMAHSNGDDFFLYKHQPGRDKSKYVFFPGCQLGATAQNVVKKTYADLRERVDGGVGLMLGCCGAIGKWAARESLFNEAIDKITVAWQQLGRPCVITACPTCHGVFTERIKEMNVVGVWDILNDIGLLPGSACNMTLAVHDACTARENNGTHSSIRNLLDKLGVNVIEPEYTKDTTLCCGYGGLTGYTNREVSDKMARGRISQIDYDFVAYCVNCRDRFMDNGRKAYHILELVYGGYDENIKTYGWSERREGRERLKRELLSELWGEKSEEKTRCIITLDDGLYEQLQSRMILMDDIKSVIEHAEATGIKLKHEKTGLFVASKKIGSVTFWVWYSPSGDSFNNGVTDIEAGGEKRRNSNSFTVYKAYSHRMIIEGM